MHDLGERGQAVGCTGGVGDNFDVGLVLLLVDAHDEHGCVCGGCRDNNLLGATLQMGLGLLSGGEHTGRFDDIVCAGVFPWDIGGVFLCVEFDSLAVDDKV